MTAASTMARALTMLLVAPSSGFLLGLAPQPMHRSPAVAMCAADTSTTPNVDLAAAAIAEKLADPLREWLVQSAGVSPSFVDRVIEICDEEMIGNVENMRVASRLGLVQKLFKPVVAMGIETALGASSTTAAPAAPAVAAGAAPPTAGAAVVEAPLDLEVEPYWDLSNLPINTFKPKKPHLAAITSVRRIVGLDAPGEVCQVDIDTGGAVKYWEGQSLGVLPPGKDPKTGKPNSVRLYSIASTRYGDDLKGQSVSLCVRRATYWCPELKAEDPAKKGVCSNFLCDAKPGDEVKVSGPTGKVMLMPEQKPETDLIMVATGTGIAPYRGFLRRLFVEANTPAAQAYSGLAWLFLGVPTTSGLLYADDWSAISERNPEHFRVSYAISREQSKADGGKMYVQDRMAEHAEEIFARMDAGAHMYFCGLKGMMPGILEMLERVASSKGLEWEPTLARWKENHQWHVEVY